jgi:hypothetical protein
VKVTLYTDPGCPFGFNAQRPELGAAGDVGLAAGDVEAWLADGEVEAALRAATAATRDPLPEALALATAEVSELRGIAIEEAREELKGAGATFTPSANDGYWEA